MFETAGHSFHSNCMQANSRINQGFLGLISMENIDQNSIKYTYVYYVELWRICLRIVAARELAPNWGSVRGVHLHQTAVPLSE